MNNSQAMFDSYDDARAEFGGGFDDEESSSIIA
jgi:hypothetical protein